MEYLQGDPLESSWATLPDPDKDLILVRLRSVLSQIRTLPSPGFFDGVNKSYMPHHLFHWPGYDPDISGPFETELGLILGLILKSRRTAESNKRHSALSDFFEHQLAHDLIKFDHTSTFTYSDLQRKKILVREILPLDATGQKDYEVSIVDWEAAGWYPIYWDYVSAFFSFKWNDDWPSRTTDIIDAWPAEAAMMRMIYQDLWL